MSRALLALAGALLQAAIVLAPGVLARTAVPPAPCLVVATLVGIATALEISVQDPAGDRSVARGTDAWLAQLSGLALLATFVTASVEASTAALSPSWIATALGAALLAGGAALRVAAVCALGPRFVAPAIAPDRLVTDGVYRFMRHPSELGLLSLALGACVACESLAALLWCSMLAATSSIRCRREDAVLASLRADPA